MGVETAVFVGPCIATVEESTNPALAFAFSVGVCSGSRALGGSVVCASASGPVTTTSTLGSAPPLAAVVLLAGLILTRAPAVDEAEELAGEV